MTDMVIHTYNPSIQESEAGRSQALSSQYKTLSQKRKGGREGGRKLLFVSVWYPNIKLVHYCNDTFHDPLKLLPIRSHQVRTESIQFGYLLFLFLFNCSKQSRKARWMKEAKKKFKANSLLADLSIIGTTGKSSAYKGIFTNRPGHCVFIVCIRNIPKGCLKVWFPT